MKIDDKSYRRLNSYAGMIRMRENRPVSLNDALSYLLMKIEKSDISDFVNSWDMSEKEAKKIDNDIRRVWSTWKVK